MKKLKKKKEKKKTVKKVNMGLQQVGSIEISLFLKDMQRHLENIAEKSEFNQEDTMTKSRC